MVILTLEVDISCKLHPGDGSLTVNAITDIYSGGLNFHLRNIDIPTVAITTPNFSLTGNITSQTASGTYNVDFGGGVTGTASASLSGSGGFSIVGGISVTF